MWDNAYLEQAKSDWETYQVLSKHSRSACHELHYLQMTTEKLGKAALLRKGIPLEHVRGTHKAFVRALQMASKNRGLQQVFGINARQLQAYIRGILPLARQIERLAPALAIDGPNVEYPWEDPITGNVYAPTSYHFLVTEHLNRPNGRKLLRLIHILLDQFDRFF
ncbi:MAG: hypothetical protein ACPGWR_19170 [Ardenticatenaceae bacterium]